MKVFAERLRQARTERGMTQQQLADRAGLNKFTIGEYERNSIDPKVTSLVSLAKELDCSTDFLCGLEN